MSGKVIHFDIPIDDPQRAVEFYEKALGWSLERWGQVPYWTTAVSEGPGIGGALTMRSPDAPNPLLYISVDDIDAALLAIEIAGGRRLSDRMPIPTVGWAALFEDSEGNRVGLFQSDPTVPMPG